MDEWMFNVGDRVEIADQNTSPTVRGRQATVTGFRGDYGLLAVDGLAGYEVLFTKAGQNCLTLVSDLNSIPESDLLEVLNL